MKIAIIDYGMGNLKSVYKAFVSLGADVVVTSEAYTLKQASHIVLPGVGAFKDAMIHLQESGLSDEMTKAIQQGKPFLGICLGMQLLFEKSYEHGEYEGLGILPGEIVKFQGNIKIPHMGWNSLEIEKKEPLFKEIKDESYVYFVHSYHLKTQADIVSAYTTYGERVPVAVQKDHIFGMQFHPEKSSVCGLQMLSNFMEVKA